MKDRLYPASETVLILRQALGNFRAWDDCLADMRRGRTTVCGYVLKPACKLHDGKAWRPAYAWEDIKAFVRSVFSVAEEAKARVPAQGKVVAYDASLPWWAQKIRAKRISTTVS